MIAVRWFAVAMLVSAWFIVEAVTSEDDAELGPGEYYDPLTHIRMYSAARL